MPNWCFNELDVAGATDEIQRLMAAVMPNEKDDNIELLARLIPLPADATVEMELGTAFTDTGYQTALDLWGSKWADCHTELIEEDEEFVQFAFDSAWGPPEVGFITLSKMFPTLTFTLRYYEMGMGFRGDVRIKDGVRIFEHYDDQWGLNFDMFTKAGLTEQEIDEAQEFDYSEYVWDFSRSSDDITGEIIQTILSKRSENG